MVEATVDPVLALASCTATSIARMRLSRSGWSTSRPPLTRTSRWTRFLAVLGSGTLRKLIDGPVPEPGLRVLHHATVATVTDGVSRP